MNQCMTGKMLYQEWLNSWIASPEDPCAYAWQVYMQHTRTCPVCGSNRLRVHGANATHERVSVDEIMKRR